MRVVHKSILAIAFSLLASCADDGALVGTWTIHFEQADATISTQERAVVEEAARAAVDARVCVIGHADDVGDPEDNLALGEARAANVVDVLVIAGVDRARIDVRSAGETEPETPGTDVDARARNRRVVVALYRAPPPEAPPPIVDAPVDVLDLPVPPPSVPLPAKDEPREAPPLKMQPRPRKPVTWIDEVDPGWRPMAGAAVVGVGAACGASVVVGAPCFAPFSAPFGVTIAAESMGLAAEPDALSGASVGAVAGSLVGLAAIAVIVAVVPPSPNPTSEAAAVLSIVPASTVLGAGIGAAAGWWVAN